MEEQSQPDGFYPRINASMLQSGSYANLIVSIVGTLESTDGSTINLRAVDKQNITISIDPDFEFHQGKNVEIIGAVSDTNDVQGFVSRNMGSDFDPEIYDQMIQLQQDPKYAEYFAAAR